MQHEFGKPLHRTTCWRRKNTPKHEFVVEHKMRGQVLREFRKKHGRRLSEDALTESFILFAGAVIELHNTKKYCDYGEVFDGVAQGVMGFCYYKVPEENYKQLVESKFPPQLLAVVVSDLIPLNLITRGGRHTSVKKDFRGKVKELTWEQVLENESDHASGRPIQKFSSLNSANNVVTDNDGIGEQSGQESLKEQLAKKILARDEPLKNIKEWAVSVGIKLPNNFDSRVAEHFKISKKKGTPVHRIMFHGGIEISRRMACYWRNDCREEYNRCQKFIVENLLKTPAPVAPYHERVVTYGPSFNAKFNEAMEQLHPEAKDYIKKTRERLASHFQRG
jgi:hypothetical protein